MDITKHGLKRIKQRLGLSKKSAVRICHKVYKYGIHQKNIKNRSIKKYVESTVRIGYYGILYCRYLFIFSNESDTMITILNIPNKYVKILENKKEDYYNEFRKCKKNKKNDNREWNVYKNYL